jgi:hypothetical protein
LGLLIEERCVCAAKGCLNEDMPERQFLANSYSHEIFKFGPRRIVSRQHMQVQQFSHIASDVRRTYGFFPVSNNIDHVIPPPVKAESAAKYAYTETGLLLRR